MCSAPRTKKQKGAAQQSTREALKNVPTPRTIEFDAARSCPAECRTARHHIKSLGVHETSSFDERALQKQYTYIFYYYIYVDVRMYSIILYISNISMYDYTKSSEIRRNEREFRGFRVGGGGVSKRHKLQSESITEVRFKA